MFLGLLDPDPVSQRYLIPTVLDFFMTFYL
jgi:hypothetical protein